MVKNRVTLKDVARRAGVSYQTVSKLINRQIRLAEETEQRIWQAIQDLGYTPHYNARSLRAQRSFTIGYSWPPSPPDETNPILDQFLQSMFVAAEARGYYLLMFPYHYEVEKQIAAYADLIDAGRVDGFILSSVEYNDPRIRYLQERNFPFVAFGRSNPEWVFPCIDVDGGQGLYEVTRHLITLGHRRIAVLAWPRESRVGNNRLEGYLRALKESALPIDENLILRGEGKLDFGYRATHQLLNLPPTQRPTAIVALNDYMAIGAMQAAQEQGIRIGEDLAISGFDDIPLARYLTPPLTSIRQPIWEIGQHVIQRLIDIIENGQTPEPQCLLVPPTLIVRASTDPTVKANPLSSKEVMSR
ncbi:LacI family DNA-binding transcriptional regulator [Thermanaerothrix sp.]|jgi:DNA-binding LacI/PurR family transcriptional regulator|uniref:LacI family DNA-binding transcriptional regulator n=1 Tax=Thermanaerothrix sp. TaxID=2972675 RepID=UPI002ADD64AF|nr:LacI family DNA-binding transcriptional regulator [Thermanaerothrix sp.]